MSAIDIFLISGLWIVTAGVWFTAGVLVREAIDRAAKKQADRLMAAELADRQPCGVCGAGPHESCDAGLHS